MKIIRITIKQMGAENYTSMKIFVFYFQKLKSYQIKIFLIFTIIFHRCALLTINKARFA